MFTRSTNPPLQPYQHTSRNTIELLDLHNGQDLEKVVLGEIPVGVVRMKLFSRISPI
jgi:hypothetical protein